MTAVLLLTLAACDAPAPAPTQSACEQRTFEDTLFTACLYLRGRDRLTLTTGGPSGPWRSFAALERGLGPREGIVRFAMNAGMFDDEGNPIGLYVENGQELHAINRRNGAGNFHMLPNGVFEVDADGRASVVPAENYDPAAPPRFATQSGPMLVIDNVLHPAIQPNGQSLYIRNAVGVPDSDHAWFVISETPVSFGRLARFLRDGLGCRNALYLDGAVSSLWDRPAARQDERAPLGPIVVVFAARFTVGP